MMSQSRMKSSSLTLLLLSSFFITLCTGDEGEIAQNGLPPNCGYRKSRMRATGNFLKDSYNTTDWDPAGPAVLVPQIQNGQQCLYSLNVTGLVPNKTYEWKVSG